MLHFGLQNRASLLRGTLFQNGQNQRLNWIFLHLLTLEFAQKVDLVAKIELFKVWDRTIFPKSLKGLVSFYAVKNNIFWKICSNCSETITNDSTMDKHMKYEFKIILWCIWGDNWRKSAFRNENFRSKMCSKIRIWKDIFVQST